MSVVVSSLVFVCAKLKNKYDKCMKYFLHAELFVHGNGMVFSELFHEL